jgi:dephospho-CoA kinase
MIIGLTGGMGSGKSTVARMLEILGCAVFSSDKTAKETYYDPQIRMRISNLLGRKSYRSNGKINKPYISSKIFSDNVLLHQLNGIIHPAVRHRMETFISQHAGQIIIKETALLFEAGLENDVEKVILVVADDAQRIKRVMKRDGLEEAEVLLRLKAQLPQEEKIKKADYIIYNNDKDLVIPQIIEVFNKLQQQQNFPI